MNNNVNFYKTEVTIEVVISHQFDISSAIQTVIGCLQFPAIQEIRIKDVKTNYQLHDKPSDVFIDVEV